MNDINEYVEKIEKALKEKISSTELVTDANNIVIRFKKDDSIYFAKFYRQRATHADNEIMLYEKIPLEGRKYLKKLTYSNFKTEEDLKFAIFEEVEGELLADLLERNELSDELADKVAKSMIDYFNIISKIKTNQYGNLVNSLEGKYSDYLKYLYEYQFPTTETLFLDKKTRKISSLPYKLLEENAEFLDEGYSCVTPIDSNFRNIMITKDEKVKIIDPGAIVSAPLNMGLGELVAHSYGTIVYDKLMENMKATEIQKRKLSIYGILSSLNVMAFLVRNKIGDIEKSKPFGNKNTFFELIEGHLRVIESTKKEIDKLENLRSKFVFIGGGENGREGTRYETEEIDKEIVKLSKNRENAKFLFLAHGNEYEDSYYKIMKKIYTEKFNCECEMLSKEEIIDREIVQRKLNWADIVYVGGGNTLQMMNIWKENGFDKILKSFLNEEKIFCGISAGAICWCKYGVSDSKKEKADDDYIKVDGMNVLNMLFCPSYDERVSKEENLDEIIKNAKMPMIALEKGTAIVIENGEYRIVKSINENKVYKVFYTNEKKSKIELSNKNNMKIDKLIKTNEEIN